MSNISQNHRSEQMEIEQLRNSQAKLSKTFDSFMENFTSHSATIKTNRNKIDDINKRLTDLGQSIAKLQSAMAVETTQVKRFCEVESMLQKFNTRVDELRNSILTTDNYVDKYLGFKMTKMTIQTLREIFKEEG